MGQSTAALAMGDVRPIRSPDVQLQRLPDGSVLLFHHAHNRAYVVTPATAHVWEWCDGATSPSKLSDTLAAIYDADRQRIGRDVVAVLYDLAAHGLVTI
jgi:hypothetical protein